MRKTKYPQIISANALLSGAVVYLRKDGGWSSKLSDAWVLEPGKETDALLAKAESRSDEIVGAYLSDVEYSAGGDVSPLHFREVFRSKGPSNYFHGKQAGE